jgi:outer membrane protein
MLSKLGAVLKRATILWLLLTCASGVAVAQDVSLGPFESGSVTIAIVTDGHSPGDTLVGLIEAELRQLVAERPVALTFKRDPAFDGGWDPEGINRALRAALNDPSVDFVLTTGLLTTQAAIEVELNKPVLSGFLQRLDLFRVADLEGDRSLKKNMSFVLLAGRVEADLATLREIEAPSVVHLALAGDYVDHVEGLAAEISRLEEVANIRVVSLPLPADVEDFAAGLPADLEAVLLGSTPRLDRLGRAALIDGFTERRIPTFSIIGHDDLDLGVMAARTPPTATLTARRVALNLNELIGGAEVDQLPVLVTSDPQLVIEGIIAAAVGYRPSLITVAYATIRDADALDLDEVSLSLAGAMDLAKKGNRNLAISGQEVEISKRERQLTLSPMLPQVEANLGASWTDPVALEGLIPERLVQTGVQARQMIYDDATISRYRASGRLYEGQQHNYQTARLDVMQQAGVGFLRLQLARSLYQIELSNLRLTEENLELARFREQVGYSGRDEVFRWEAEVAKRRTDLYQRMAVVETEEVALNQILGVAQDTRWETEAIIVESTVFPFLGGRLPSLVTDVIELERFRQFAVGFAVEEAPELLSVGKSREAREIELGQRRRSWFLPSLFADFSWSYHIDRDPALEDATQSVPRLSIGAAYPIFQGAARSFQVSRSTAELDRVLEQEALTRDLVERAARTSFSRLEASFPSIRFSRAAARSAGLNFELVQDKYAQGLVNVTDLLSAQTESFSAEQTAAAAVSAFLIDLVNFQRSISWFEDDHTGEEQDALVRRIDNAIE